MKERIISQPDRLPSLDDLTPELYDQFVLERNRDSVAVSCRDLLRQVLDQNRLYETLEVGAGTGIGTKRLNELGNLKVVALDRKKDFLEYAIRLGRMEQRQAVLGDFNSLPFGNATFDLYTGIAILNQRDNIEQFYAEALRVLKKDGLIFLPWTKKNPKSMDPEKSFFLQN